MLYKFKSKVTYPHMGKYKFLHSFVNYHCKLNNFRVLRFGYGWEMIILGAPLLYNDNKTDIYAENASYYQKYLRDIELLCNKEKYIYNSSTHLLLPCNMKDLKTSPFERINKQIMESTYSKQIYVRVSKNQAIRLTDALTQCSKNLNLQISHPYTVKDFPSTVKTGVLETEAMKQEFELMQYKSKTESFTYGFMNMLLNSYFKAEDGYIVVPQSKQVTGEIYFLVKKKLGKIVVVIESKAADGHYSAGKTYIQGIEYANTNWTSESVFIIVNKGEFISIGLYVQDFHTINH